MATERLQEFTLDLCDYVLGQIRPHLRALPHRPLRPLPPLDYNAFQHLSPAEWIGRGVAVLPALLGDHVWAAGVQDGATALPLNDDELFALELVVDDPPARCEAVCVWEPFPALHRQSVECVPEIRAGLTKQTAQDWASDSAAFSVRLCQEGLSLADGVAIVQEWLSRARRLMGLMGDVELLPYPLGSQATPTLPDPPHRPTVRPEACASAQGERGRGGLQGYQAGKNDNEVCDWREAMAATGLKKTKLYELFHRGTLRGYKDGAMIRFYRTGLAAYMRDRENAPPPQPCRPARPRKGPTRPMGTNFKFL